MLGPTVVKVLVPAYLEPVADRVRRIVALSDGSECLEHGTSPSAPWVPCPEAARVYVDGFILGDVSLRQLGIPPDAGNGTGSGGS